MKKFLLAGVYFLSTISIQAQLVNDTLKFKYIIDTSYSTALSESRKIGIYLPENYKPGDKYPVIYTLDAGWMFEPAIFEAKKLADFNVIPPCIVVGIYSPNRRSDMGWDLNTGEFSTSSNNFLTYLAKELIPKIQSQYTTSKFNILIGHSDGATFAQKAMIKHPEIFSGVIALSQNLFGEQTADLSNYIKKKFVRPHYYYVASGTRDATSRIKSGKVIDSIMKTNTTPLLNYKSTLYEADHSGIAAKGLGDGISFIFSDFFEPNDWNRSLIDSLINKNTDPVTFVLDYVANINNLYDINMKPGLYGILFIGTSIANSKPKMDAFYNRFDSILKSDGEYYSIRAQKYERLKEYDAALEYWNAHLAAKGSSILPSFYYRRPVELLGLKMKKTKEAVLYAEKWISKIPDLKFPLSYTIAEICATNGIEKKKGLIYINYFIENYAKENTYHTLDEAEKIKKRLLQR
ncbi:MAG: alpha/beta hydrolase-fold protein [Niabella sp.]